MRRHWLDWTGPLLPAAAVWLLEHGRRGTEVDLQRVVCVLPGRRAGRTLVGHLVAACEAAGLGLVPPRTITPGLLGDALLSEAPAVASRPERRLAWASVLRGCAERVLAPLVPTPPAPEDALGWHLLAATIDDVHEELAAEGLGFADASARAEERGLTMAAERFGALAEIAVAYRAALGAAGLLDAHDAVRDALRRGDVNRHDEVVLIGVTELNGQQRALVNAVGDRAIGLVHAPRRLRDHFDAFGCVHPEPWRTYELSLEDDRIVVADGPYDQAQAGFRAIAGLGGTRGPDEITIGVGDPSLIEPLTQAAAWAGLGVHSAAGVELRRTAPFRLLEAVAAWRGAPRFAGLAALVRHPDVERWLVTRRGGGEAGAGLGRLDRVFAAGLPDRLAAGGPDDADGELGAVRTALDELLAPLRGPPRDLAAWCAAALEVLGVVYADDGGRGPSEAAIAACLELRDVCAPYASAPAPLRPETDAATALELVLAEAGGERIAPEVRPDQIELLGWLEVHADPAPALVLLGVNDGRIPETLGADPFLPDTLRQELGLMDDDRRYARDAYRLEAIRHSREHLTVVTGRGDARGEPLAPSRLLLACPDAALPGRVRGICGRAAPEQRSLPAGAPPFGELSRFTVPALPAGLEPPESMRVTDFRTYLACPYRYALARRLRLASLHDRATELDALQFGTLVHRVLEAFGADPAVSGSDDAGRIEAFLLDALDAIASRRYGPRPRPAVRLQIARLRPRLRAFARLQTQLRRAGWVIEDTELDLDDTCRLDVPGGAPMPIRGVIDRVDRHERTGAWRIIDYKTGERGAGPLEIHHGRKTLPPLDAIEWLDLQLPLYDLFAPRCGIDGDVELAYLVLPARADAVEVKSAPWTPAHLEDAVARARAIVRDVRAGRFDRNPAYGWALDPFARICQTLTGPEDDEGAET